MNLYISDLHFGHKNVIRFDNRPFADVEEMDRCLIAGWNKRVGPSDDVWIVGDFCYKSRFAPENYLRRLSGRKHLVVGNHDDELLANPKAMSYFESVDQIAFIEDDGPDLIVLCHYPIASWKKQKRGSWLIHGHIHCRTNEPYQYMKQFDRALNCGCMINLYQPASLAELIENNRRFRAEN